MNDALIARYPDAAKWTVTRIYRDRRKVGIAPDGSLSLPRWLADMRRLLPAYMTFPPTDLLRIARESGGLDLGVIPGREAYRISVLLKNSATVVTVEDASSVEFFPSVGGQGLIIENEEEARAFCLDLIARGARQEMAVE